MTAAFDRQAFYSALRSSVFRNALSHEQVDGCEAILAEAERRALPLAFTAYILATAFWETGQKMQPVEEIGKGRGHPYGVPDPETKQVYYGRGLVQLTWKANYAKFERLCGAALVADPGLALGMPVAVTILFEGMIRGLFTGRTLADYCDGPVPDYAGARNIVNGRDHAAAIAIYARQFEAALTAAPASAATTPPPASWGSRIKSYFTH